MTKILSMDQLAKDMGIPKEELEKKIELSKPAKSDVGQIVAKIKLIHNGVVKKFSELHIEYIVLIDPKNPKIKYRLGNVGAHEPVKIKSKKED